MKRAPHSLTPVSGEEAPVTLSGPDAELRIERLGAGVYDIRYDFSAYPVDPELEAAAKLHYDPDFLPETAEGFTNIRTEEGRLSLTDGKYQLEVELSSGSVALRRGGRLIHGGPVGSSDTVLPRYPLRVHGILPSHVSATFNFPLTEHDRFFGLGDKGGDLDRRNRRFMMHNRDALGYHGSFADPLYKSIPFVIKWNPEKGIWLGIAVTAPDVVSADFGVESQYYYSFTIRNGPYRYLLLPGDSYAEVLEKYTRVTGRPAFPPAFTFGFLGSSMDYSEPDDAQERILAYLERVEEEGIPCEGLYLSSGYYKAKSGLRHTFVWNKDRFPDPDEFISGIRNRGYHLACNIKPGILVTHPRLKDYARKNALVMDSDGVPYTEFYWGSNAAFWNFGDSGAFGLWQEELDREILARGVDGVWNDNNEYEIEDSTVPAYSRRSLFALQMCAASFESLKQRNPGRRPWVISRSGGIGIQRYARTWSGDNASTWEGLRYNFLQGSSMGLSGLPFFGHDVGGFYGERGDWEEFLSWCQAAVFQPRFVLHSWNSDGNPTELWSYPEILSELKALVQQHYEFMPYVYSNAYRAHLSGLPLQRPLVLEFPEENLPSDTPAYLYGDSILVLPATEAGQTEFRLRLPSGRWYDPDTQTFLEGGGDISVALERDHTRYLLRAGSIVPRSPGAGGCDRGWYDPLVIDLIPGGSGCSMDFFEDDGISSLNQGSWRSFALQLQPAERGKWRFSLRRIDKNGWNPPADSRSLSLRLPPGYSFTTSGTEGDLIISDFGPTVRELDVTIAEAGRP